MAEDFLKAVYGLVARIPEGCVVSYGQLAMMAGRPRSARIVGQIMSRYAGKENLPCHRVIKADGRLCEGHEFGLFQREMLRVEGVPFLPDGRVDIKACRWSGHC